jgi:hypothetical protein
MLTGRLATSVHAVRQHAPPARGRGREGGGGGVACLHNFGTVARHHTNTGSGGGAGGSTGGVELLGVTQDAGGCRGACEVCPNCTSYTWKQEGGLCYSRTDFLWLPNVTDGGAALVSGRPWGYTGDNPAPCMDLATGNVSVLYRTDSHAGGHVDYQVVSTIPSYLHTHCPVLPPTPSPCTSCTLPSLSPCIVHPPRTAGHPNRDMHR